MLKKIAFPSFSKVLGWVWGIGNNRWFKPLIGILLFTLFGLWIWSFQRVPTESPALVDNTTEAPPTANVLTPPAGDSATKATSEPSDSENQVIQTSIAQTVQAVDTEVTPTTTLTTEEIVGTAVALTLTPNSESSDPGSDSAASASPTVTSEERAQTAPTATPVPPTAVPVQPTAVPVPPTAVPVPPTAVPVPPTAVPVPPTAVPVPPTAVPVPPTAVPVPTASAPYPYSCVGKFEGSNALEQALAKCPGVTFRVRWTSPRDWDGCMFNSNNIPSDFGSQQVLQGQKLVFWIPRLDEDLSFLPDCHARISQPSSGGPSLVNSTSECRGMFEGNDALNIARQACGNKEFRVRWTNPRDPYGCMFTSNRVPKDFNSPEVMQGQKLVFWIPLDSEDMSSISPCPNLP